MSGWPPQRTGSGRREPRVRVDLAAVLAGRAPRPARVVDVSRIGCLLRSDAALDGGAVVDLRFDLPDGPVHTKARVAGASLDGDSPPDGRPLFLAGLEFLGLAAADDARLRSFIHDEAKRSRGAHTPAP
ncbi:MAG TPA: PilZ domain-containing protein [Vicinamibacteria bacterium]|nr:PilZ domain-containing protein [Vicinamibacteria bacterium]